MVTIHFSESISGSHEAGGVQYCSPFKTSKACPESRRRVQPLRSVQIAVWKQPFQRCSNRFPDVSGGARVKRVKMNYKSGELKALTRARARITNTPAGSLKTSNCSPGASASPTPVQFLPQTRRERGVKCALIFSLAGLAIAAAAKESPDLIVVA